jgi:mono/diheme cytochrome c family protein
MEINPASMSGWKAAAVACLLGTTASVAAAQEASIEYNRDIRPILADNCFACHGPDSASRKADLRLDKADAATAMKAIIAGKPGESGVIHRINSTDPDEVMPPPATRKSLTARQKDLLKRWIASGAEYQPHWSFIAPTRPAVPQVKQPAWIRNPIDAFVLAKLEANGMTPAPEADRRTLARRLSLDLIGLPPTPELVEAFVADQSPDAYEKLVDKLMESKHWGEHRGRYWLDAARYADTHGIHFDNFREMWTYRDSVIAAFNRNTPFDQFTIQQLAGDLLPNRSMDQQIESGFNRCNITTSEGGTIPEEYYVLYARDRTETFGQVWLGMTVGCAVCHDHKFDPVTTRDFYSMAAFFNNTTQNAMDGNAKDTPPIIIVPLPADRARWDAIGGEIATAKQQVEERKKEARPLFDAWLAQARPESLAAAIPTNELSLHAKLSEGDGRSTSMLIDGQPRDVALNESAQWTDGISSKALQVQGAACDVADAGDFDKDQPFTCAAWVKLQPNDSQGAIAARMDKPSGYQGWDFWVQGRRVGMHLISQWPDDALKVVGQAQIKPNEWTHVAISYDGSAKAAGVKVYYNGQLQKTNVENDRLKSSTRTKVPFRIGQRTAGEPISGAGIQDLRLYKRALSAGEVESIAKVTRFTGILAKAPEQRTDADKNEVFPWWLSTNDAPFQERSNKVAVLESEQAAIKGRGTIAHVMQEKSEEAMAYILFRGEYDKRRDPVKPNTPESLPAYPADAPRNRLGLAKWVLEPTNPLTARVTVNRFWQELFGTGIVRTSGDFGIAGELPSDQALLDWLAIEFRESGWDVKKFYKLIVTSNTYRQSAQVTADKLEKDPQNRLMSRGPRFRMDGEMIRDYALSASGLLVPKIGGPSVKPYQPEGVWEAVAMIGSNTRDYRRDTGENLYRRSLYTFIKRSAPPASMEIFNAPARETCTVRRERTDTPLQALVTLNDVQFVEAARNLAQLVLKSPAADDTARLHLIANRLLARPFAPRELPIVQSSLKDLKDYYQAHVDDARKLIAEGESKADPNLDPATLAAWTMLANELMNLDEVLNK